MKHLYIKLNGKSVFLLEGDKCSPNIIYFPTYVISNISDSGAISVNISTTTNGCQVWNTKFFTKYELENAINAQFKYNDNLKYNVNNFNSAYNDYRKFLYSKRIYDECEPI